MAGVIARGIKAPLIRAGDDLVSIVVEAIKSDTLQNNYKLQNNDIICITEAVIARSDNTYASVFNIASDVKEKFKSGHVGVCFPIFSRNRFETILRGIALGANEVTLVLNYPSDEVGNALFSEDKLRKTNINPYRDELTLEEFKELFGESSHSITGVNYVDLYLETIKKAGAKPRIIFSNNVETILKYTNDILISSVHNRKELKDELKEIEPSSNVLTLDEILNKTTTKHGYNEQFGVLGANKASDDLLKLFPRNSKEIVNGVQKAIREEFGVDVEVLAFGDGAYKDPETKIWELADPVVGLAYTPRLALYPTEVKLKNLLDDKFKDLKGEELELALKEEIEKNATKNQSYLGTTPRRFANLLGSLSDLVMGSGDKGTPFVLIQNYFSHFGEKEE